MGISSVTSSVSSMQMTVASSTDYKNRSIEKEIKDVQQQKRAVASKEDLSVNEKENEKKTLQKKITSLNTELKQHQEELLQSQKREIKRAELQEDTGSAKEEKAERKIQAEESSLGKTDETKGAGAEKETKAIANKTDKGITRNETKATASSGSAAQRAGRQGTVISKTSDGVVILKGKISQDEKSGVKAEKKLTDESPVGKTDEKNQPVNKPQTDENKEKANVGEETKTSASDKDTGLSSKEIHAIVSKENSVRQTNRQETVIARIEGGIAVLKGEIDQDENRGIDTEQKRTDLKQMEKREERARELQSSILSESGDAMDSAVKVKVSGAEGSTQVNTENNTFNVFQNQEQDSQQRFYVSLGVM